MVGSFRRRGLEMRFALLFLLVLFSSSHAAKAETIDIDLSTLSLTGELVAPCYCGAAVGPIYTIQAAAGTTIDFGQVQLNWVLVSPTPDDFSNYHIEYIQSIADINFTGDGSLAAAYNVGGLGCTLGPAMCGLQPIAVDLLYTIPQNADSIEIGWFAGTYLAPAVPEPSTWAMLLLGFAGVSFMAYRRARAAQ
jgi:PEP-CTERM motif-containing protein